MVLLPQQFMVVKDQLFNVPNDVGRYTLVSCQANRLEPKLTFARRRGDMDMRRLPPFVRVEVEAKRAYSQNGRHGVQVLGDRAF
jgi:hypothetical protein